MVCDAYLRLKIEKLSLRTFLERENEIFINDERPHDASGKSLAICDL